MVQETSLRKRRRKKKKGMHNANKSEREGERKAGGLQSNPCLSQCALITLEQSEKHGATG